MTKPDTSKRTRFASAVGKAVAVFMRETFDARDVVALLGAALIAYGAGDIFRPAGFIVGGGLLLIGAFLHARAKP